MRELICRVAAALGTLAIAACGSAPPAPPARHADATTTIENGY